MYKAPFLKKDIRAVFFDLDNTLIDRNKAFRMYVSEWLKMHAPNVKDDEYSKKLNHILQKDAWGYTDRSDFSLWLKTEYDLSHLSPEVILRDFLDHIPLLIQPDFTLLDKLSKLKHYYQIGVISNGSSKSQRTKLRQAKLDSIFSDELVFIEGERGYAKPHSALFDMAIQKTRFLPEEILFVGDDPTNDMLGAARQGMQTGWMAHHRSLMVLKSQPQYVFNSQSELFDVLLPQKLEHE
jgi:putative hydrolase of the HAD superfamily